MCRAGTPNQPKLKEEDQAGEQQGFRHWLLHVCEVRTFCRLLIAVTTVCEPDLAESDGVKKVLLQALVTGSGPLLQSFALCDEEPLPASRAPTAVKYLTAEAPDASSTCW